MRTRSNYSPLRTRGTRRSLKVFLSVLSVLCGGVFVAVASAQFQMPDPKQMAGIPRPVTDLPDGSISVRLIRGQLSNNIAGHPVEAHLENGRVVSVKTDDAGRSIYQVHGERGWRATRVPGIPRAVTGGHPLDACGHRQERCGRWRRPS